MEREIGHVRRHVDGYFVVDQDHEATRLSRKRCPDCATGRARADPALPPLTGSSRQVAWAGAIRQADPVAADRAIGEADARWWIDRRRHRPAGADDRLSQSGPLARNVSAR